MEKKRSFGRTAAGKETTLYTLVGASGLEVDITDYGATIVSIRLPDGTDVALGYDDAKGYEEGTCFFGATVGRNANRIKDAKAEIGGKIYELEVNDNGNNLHSSFDNGYHKRIWEVIEFEGDYLAMRLESPHMDQGFPGNAEIVVTFLINDGNGLEISYNAKADATTTFNLTNHTYFNLSGHASGVSVLEDRVQINANAYTPVDDLLIPTGEKKDVTGTVFDFRTCRKIEIPYDHNYMLDHEASEGTENTSMLRFAAALFDDNSKVKMEVYTNSDAMQMYTGGSIALQTGKNGASYGPFDGICFESQFAPNSINMDDFAIPEYEPGERFVYTTMYRFSKF